MNYGGPFGSDIGGAGGNGSTNNYRTGSDVTYAGGGAGGACRYQASGGSGGGAAGGWTFNSAGGTPDTSAGPLNPSNASANTGGGGGGGRGGWQSVSDEGSSRPGSNGGSGIVVIRYT